jgi:protein SCO1/2
MVPLLALLAAAGVGTLTALLVSHARGREPAAAVRFVPPREPAPGFRLRDQEGRWVRLADARGKVLVLTFLYSKCRDLCPAQARKIKDAVLDVGLDHLVVYGVSVDPVGDTQENVRAWVERMGLTGAPVHFLIGSRAQLEPVWRQYGIAPIEESPEGAERRADEYKRLRGYEPPSRAVAAEAHDPYPSGESLRFQGRPRHKEGDEYEHSAYVLLLDKRGEQRVGFPFEQLRTRLLADDIRALIAES